jgi:hypothetical protein
MGFLEPTAQETGLPGIIALGSSVYRETTHPRALGQPRLGGGGAAEGAGEDHSAQGNEAEGLLGDPLEERRPQGLADEGGGHEEGDAQHN